MDTVLLPYAHYSVLIRLDKRVAGGTGLDIDGRKLMDLDRSGIKRRLDRRLGEDQQTGSGSTPATTSTVSTSSAEPQPTGATPGPRRHMSTKTPSSTPMPPRRMPSFNQGMELWLGLQSYLQDHAADSSGGPWSSPARAIQAADRIVVQPADYCPLAL